MILLLIPTLVDIFWTDLKYLYHKGSHVVEEVVQLLVACYHDR